MVMKCAIPDCEDAATHSIEISMPFTDPKDNEAGISSIYSQGFCIYHGLIRARLAEIPPEIRTGIEEVIRQQKFIPDIANLKIQLVELSGMAKQAVEEDAKLRDAKVN